MKKLAIILIATFALFSCTKENIDGGSPSMKGVKILFKTSDFTQLNTRAASEIQLKDVTILQFKNGTLIQKELLEGVNFTSAVTLSFLEQLPAANLDENGKLIEDGRENLVYFIANTKAVTGAEVALTKGASTFADLKKVRFGTNNLAEVLPMIGEYYGGITEGATNQINVTLTRTVAKVNFILNTANFLDDNGAQSSIVINKIELYNAPKEITPYPCDNRPTLPANGAAGVWPGKMDPFPAYAAETFENYGVEKNNSATPLTNYIAYMPENARGSFTSIANNKDKKPEKVDPQYQDGLTHILVDLDYTTASGIVKNAKYKIYIGGDAAGDMNLLRNTQYNITTYIYGANESDTRITVSSIFDPEDGRQDGELKVQAPANCYIINPTSIPDKFTIPLSQARRGWSYINNFESNNDLLNAFDNLINSDNWEIVTLWRTWGANDANTNITGAKAEGISFTDRPDASEANYFATLKFPNDIHAGNNAVIALRDKTTKKIYWSWHLWFTDYNPDAQDPTQMNGQTHSYFGASFVDPIGAHYGVKVMDRNLGATATGVTGAISQPTTAAEAVKYYGLLYQGGRKDPFVGSSNGTTVMMTVYDTQGAELTLPKEEAGATNNLARSIHNPNTFLYVGGNWTNEVLDLWGEAGVKSPFDPSPAGWRLPVATTNPFMNTWAGFNDDIYNSAASVNLYTGSYFNYYATVGSEKGTAGRLYSYTDDTQAWYPFTGQLSYTTATLGSVGTSASYWSCNKYGSGFLGTLTIAPLNVNVCINGYRAHALPIRCVQE